MLLCPTPPMFADSGAAFAVNSHLRLIYEGGSPVTTHTTGAVTIPAAAKGAVLCLAEVDGTGGTLTARAGDVRIDDGSGASFTYRASLYNSVQDHIVSF